MSFTETQHHVEAARAELARAGTEATGWADAQRERFDKDRLKPLAEAATKLITALGKAQEAQDKIQRLLAG